MLGFLSTNAFPIAAAKNVPMSEFF